LAKERNINYKPSAEAMQNLMDYVDRKGLVNPLGGDHHVPIPQPLQPPTYNPNPGFLPPPDNNQFPPPGGPGFGQPSYMPGFIAPGQQPQPGFIGGMPSYQPPIAPN
jgi:hypothetical protein